jgi:hypothetical protein
VVREFVAQVIEQLVARHATTRRVDLNDIAEVIGHDAVSYDEVEHIIQQLEHRGCSVGGPPTPREMMLLREVLDATRALSAELQRRPTVEEIAAAADRPAFVVRRALENAGTLGRTGKRA